MYRGAILSLLLSAAAVHADPPKVPSAPVLAPAGGRPAVVTVEVPNGAEFAAAPAFAPEDCLWFPGETDAGGRKVYLVQPYKAGVYRVVFWAKGETAYSTLVIDASGVTPPTPPGPKPPDPPVPPQPDGKLGLVKASRDGLAKVTAGLDKKAALARAQRAHASAVAAGAFAGPAAILAGWRDANNEAADAAAWEPWGGTVSARLAALHAAGQLKANADWAAAFNEAAEGLGG